MKLERIDDLIFGACIGITLFGVTAIGVKKCSAQVNELQQPTETTIESTVEEDNLANQLISTVNQEEEKTFKKGEHYICVRISHHSKSMGMNNLYDNDELATLAISNIPEGYEVYSITPYTSKVGSGSSTAGFDIWFVNTEEVKVKATYNKDTKQYGYNTFGEVVEKQKQLTK